MKCPYCPKEYKSQYWLEDHVRQHEFWIAKARKGERMLGSEPPNIGNCHFCGAFVIAPATGVNFGSIANLRSNGFTGDVDVTVWGKRLYCFSCMKKHGWSWGEKEEEQTE